MEKIVIIAQKADFSEAWCQRLRGPVAEELLALGLPGVVVNVRDEPVRDAMMTLTTLEPPAAAVISLWTQQYYGEQTRAAIALIEAESDSAAAYLVTESVPMPPPDPDSSGARTPGLANVALLRRPADLDPQTWLNRWHLNHTQVAIDTQATFGYTQNVVVRALTEDAPVIDGIVEELFPDAAVSDPYAFYGAADEADLTDRVGRMIASVSAFGAQQNIDTVPTSRYVFRSPFVTRTAATA